MMKRNNSLVSGVLISLIVGAAVFCLMSCRNTNTAEPQVSKGKLDTYKDFASQFIPARTVRVWLPSDYNASQRYAVLYMHDGRMLWDAAATWNHQEFGVDEAMDSLITLGKIMPTIVVGIDNNDNRIGEYAPDDITEFLPEGKPVYRDITACGNNYLQFMVTELKPFIDSTYSVYTDPAHTFVMGSSCGGLISSYALCKYPEVFGGAACLSTHCLLVTPRRTTPDEAVIRAYRTYLQRHLPQPNTRLLYMDDGDKTLDAFYLEKQAAINEMLRAEGWDSAHFQYRLFPGHSHCEDDWQARLDIPLTFLLKGQK